MNFQQMEIPAGLALQFKERGGEVLGCFLVNQNLEVIVANNGGRLHMSVGHKRRWPELDEVRAIRSELLPMDKHFAIPVLPIGVPQQKGWVHVMEVADEEVQAEPERKLWVPGDPR